LHYFCKQYNDDMSTDNKWVLMHLIKSYNSAAINYNSTIDTINDKATYVDHAVLKDNTIVLIVE
jgi:hypothetical protein